MHKHFENILKFPENLKYNDEHIWMEYSTTGYIKCGITEYLCVITGEFINIEFVRNILNMQVNYGDPVLCAESLKDSLIIKAPFNGVIAEINMNCSDMPDLINADPYGEGWLFIIYTDSIHDIEQQMRNDEYEFIVNKEKENNQIMWL